MEADKQYSGRLAQSPAQVIQDYYTKPKLRAAGKFFHIYLTLFQAHALMLAEQGIITQKHGSIILAELNRILETGFDRLELRAELTDLYLNLQMFLIERVGEDIGGRLHTALSRNDFDLAEARLYSRERILAGISVLLDLMQVLHRLAEAHVDTVMPGYTHHSQAAQPITLGHFLLAHFDVVARDVTRMFQAYEIVNFSSMGGCALATTGFPIDRERVAELIGCDGLVENSLDATGGRDFLLQLGSAVAIAFSNMGRLTESLLLWNTREFGMITLADKYCHISSIMPQKRNPVALEIIRAEAVFVPGSVHTAFNVLKAIPLANGRETSYVDGLIFESAEKLEIIAPVLADILATTQIHKEIMLSKAQGDFSTMTELADEIVRQTDLAFHQSYLLVGILVSRVQDSNGATVRINSAAIDEIAVELFGAPLKVPDEAVRRALDPVQNVAARGITGGPAPEEVRRMLDQRRELLTGTRKRLQERMQRLMDAQRRLDAAVAGHLASHPVG